MSEGEVFPVPAAWAKRAKMNAQTYEAAVAQVETDPDGYWTQVAERLDWMTPFTQVKDTSFHKHPFHIRWYADGVPPVFVLITGTPQAIASNAARATWAFFAAKVRP